MHPPSSSTASGARSPRSSHHAAAAASSAAAAAAAAAATSGLSERTAVGGARCRIHERGGEGGLEIDGDFANLKWKMGIFAHEGKIYRKTGTNGGGVHVK